MTLFIFSVFSQYALACKYGIFGCGIAFSNTWCNNCQLSKAVIETWFKLLFQEKMFLAYLILKLIFYKRSKIINVCLLFLELTGTAKETLLARELIYSYSLNVLRKIKEKKHWTCRWKKMSKAIEENKLKVLNKRFQNLCVQTKIVIRAKWTYPFLLLVQSKFS